MTVPPSRWRTRRPPLVAAAAIVVLAVLAWVLLRPGAAPAPDETPPARLATDSGVASVVLDTAALVRAGIVTTALSDTTYQGTTTGYGTVVDVDSLAAAQTALAAAQAAATRTASSAAAAREELARIRSLNAADQTASVKALQEAEAASRGADADAAAARAAVRARQAAVLQAWGPVVARWIADGGAPLDDLLARRRVLILVALPAGTVLASPPRHASVEGPADGVEATLVSAATETDPATQGAAFFYGAPAAPGLLAGMRLTVALPVGSPVRAVVVPRSAVVWAEGGAWIYLETAPATFTRHRISTDLPAPGGYAITDLASGARVVTRGAQLLLSEEYRSHAKPVKGDEDEDG